VAFEDTLVQQSTTAPRSGLLAECELCGGGGGVRASLPCPQIRDGRVEQPVSVYQQAIETFYHRIPLGYLLVVLYTSSLSSALLNQDLCT